ncbi:hypothetical protein H7849_15400 [Alloacidobacterium dinghuense]|uniref:Uncharacterized protein n=1 Tax=Alloacidobacterium dinghuense TaxID=2763107 RepID=A0A7G8BDA7_9BACT|nr:hypothetical protein [Alloacidobacterium dinghuense]QNI30527.1 hypothetical protein H7849_15400 [Alloacidobacterium dinghuense]
MLKSESLRNLLYLADQASANYIIEVKRLQEAERRITMHERQDTHMCLEAGCGKPVVGKLMFAHCEAHLDSYEKRWFKEDIESSPAPLPETKSRFDQIFEELEKEHAGKLVQLREQALAEAYKTVSTFWSARRERRRLLPEALCNRLVAHEALLIDIDAV